MALQVEIQVFSPTVWRARAGLVWWLNGVEGCFLREGLLIAVILIN